MDLYKLQKISTSNSNHFLNINQVFHKFFTTLSFVHLPYVVMKHLPYVVLKLSAALSAVSVHDNSQFQKCLFFLQSVYFGFFLGRPTFPVFRFSSQASNRTVFVLILSPVLGLANALLGGSNVVLGCGG
jgi:hypothetical protein